MKVYPREGIEKKNEVKHMMEMKDIIIQTSHSWNPYLMHHYCLFRSATKVYVVGDLFNGAELFGHLQREHKFPEETVKIWAAEHLD